jgi:hypothetical protein
LGPVEEEEREGGKGSSGRVGGAGRGRRRGRDIVLYDCDVRVQREEKGRRRDAEEILKDVPPLIGAHARCS